MSENDEDVSNKIDRLTSVLNQFMSDFDDPRMHASRLSIVSSVHQSFCENSALYTEDDDIDAPYIPNEFIEKFEECLLVIDRLNMRIEDFRSEACRYEEKLTEIHLTMPQIKTLHEKLADLIEKQEQAAVFKLNKFALVNGNLILPSLNVGKFGNVELEHMKLKSDATDLPSHSSKEGLSAPIDCRENFQKMIELEKISLRLKEKELELDKLHEEYGYKMARAEVLIAEYQNKLEELAKTKKRETHRKHPSQDITRTRTPVPLGPLSTSCFISDLLTTRQEIQTKLMNMEKLIKEKYKRDRDRVKDEKIENLDNLESILEEYRHKDTLFVKNLKMINDYQQKEKFIMSYFNESRIYLQKKIEDLQKLQNFLLTNWTKSNGELAGIEAVKKASAIYFQKTNELKKEREIVDDKYMRISRIKETVKKEYAKLQINRKKILAERINIKKQQQKLEQYLKSVSKINTA